MCGCTGVPSNQYKYMNADLKVCCINVSKKKVKYNDWGTGVVVFRFILQNVICLYRRYLYIVMTGRQSHNIDNNNYGLFLPQTFSKIREDYQQSWRIIRNLEKLSYI